MPRELNSHRQSQSRTNNTNVASSDASANSIKNKAVPECLNKKRSSGNQSVSALDSERKLFLPEDINFPASKMDVLASSYFDSGDMSRSSLLHQILRSSAQSVWNKPNVCGATSRSSTKKWNAPRYDSRIKPR